MRIPPVIPDDIDLAALAPKDRMRVRMRGIFAHRPTLAPAFTAFSGALPRHGELPTRLRELVRLRIAFHNQCRTCMSIRYSDARDAVTDDVVCALAAPSEAQELSAAERAAVRFADLFATDHHTIDDDVFADLRHHFDDGQVVELAMICAHYVGTGRLMAIMDVTDDLPAGATDPGVVTPWDLDETIVLD